MTTMSFYSMVSSFESLECRDFAHELVTFLSEEVFPGGLQREQKNGGWREVLENEMILKDSENIIDLLARSILWYQPTRHSTTAKTLRIWWFSCEDKTGVDRSTLLSAEMREIGQNVGEVV